MQQVIRPERPQEHGTQRDNTRGNEVQAYDQKNVGANKGWHDIGLRKKNL